MKKKDSFAIRSRIICESGWIKSDYQTGFTGTRKECVQKIHDDYLAWCANEVNDSPEHDESFDSWWYHHYSGEVHKSYVARNVDCDNPDAKSKLERLLRSLMPKVGKRAVRGHSVNIGIELEDGWFLSGIERSNHNDQSAFYFMGTRNLKTGESFNDGFHCISSFERMTDKDAMNVYYKLKKV